MENQKKTISICLNRTHVNNSGFVIENTQTTESDETRASTIHSNLYGIFTINASFEFNLKKKKNVIIQI